MRTMRLVQAVAFLSAAAVPLCCGSPAIAADKVTYNMAWLPQGSTAGVPIAIERGFYKEVGLDVSAVRGYGGNRTVNEIDQGKFEFGYGDPISIILNRSNGGKVRLVGALNTHWPAAICFIEQRHKIRSIDDLKGLTMGGGSASPVHNLVPAWLARNGRNADLIRLLRMDPAVVDASFVEGKIDLAECWGASNRAVIQKQATAAGLTVGWMAYSDHKLDIYGSGIAASDAMIAKNPDVVRRFVKATYKGYEFMARDPDGAADIMAKTYPVLDRSVVLQQIKEINELIRDKGTADHPLGWMRADRIDTTVAFIDTAFELKGAVKPTDIYTNEFVQ